MLSRIRGLCICWGYVYAGNSAKLILHRERSLEGIARGQRGPVERYVESMYCVECLLVPCLLATARVCFSWTPGTLAGQNLLQPDEQSFYTQHPSSSASRHTHLTLRQLSNFCGRQTHVRSPPPLLSSHLPPPTSSNLHVLPSPSGPPISSPFSPPPSPSSSSSCTAGCTAYAHVLYRYRTAAGADTVAVDANSMVFQTHPAPVEGGQQPQSCTKEASVAADAWITG